MGNNDIDRLRSAAAGLVLQDAQKHILAHRLSGKLSRKGIGSISAKDLLTLIDESMWDMNASVEVLEISEESYR
ncbi:MAG: hypothetical protein AAGF35_00230 [Pseudomonadota bacterium]